jgi:hypothetical protein
MSKAARSTVKHEVEVQLTSSEKADRAQSLVSSIESAKALLEKHKEIKKKLKLDEDNAQSMTDNLLEIVKTGKEKRPVECYEEPDFKKGVVTVRRVSDDTVVHTRQMTDEERQTNIAGLSDKLGNEPDGNPIVKPKEKPDTRA